MSRIRKARPKDKGFNKYNVKKGSVEMPFDKAHRHCIDKVRFYSRKTVKRVAKELGMNYYKCDFCGNWHMTSHKAIDPRKESK